VDVRAVLADVAGLGPFFTVTTDPAERVDPTWRPVGDLHTDPVPLRDRIGHVRRVLGSDDRVAASITFQGLAALLLSAPFAAVAVHGVLPALTPATLHWRPSAGGPWPLWWDVPAGGGGGPPPDLDRAVNELAGGLAAVVEGLLGPLVTAVRAQVPISQRLLCGSVASSVAAGRRLVGQQRPAAAARATRLAEQLFAGPLAGTGDLLAPAPPDTGWTFRRRSCCLYYRAPGGGLCGDCVLRCR
jgi:hypothetical protein